MAGKILTKIANFAALGIVNKILGGVFGALKIALILSVVLTFFMGMNNAIPFVNKAQLNQSVLVKPIKNLAPLLFPSFINADGSDFKNPLDEI